MKRLLWFKTGDEIPDAARYIKSETRRENIQEHESHYSPLASEYWETWDSVEYHLYEVPFRENDE